MFVNVTMRLCQHHVTSMSTSCHKYFVVMHMYVLFWQTLSLLFKMTNSLNVVVIAEKMIAYLKTTRDEYIKADLVSKITQLAERYP